MVSKLDIGKLFLCKELCLVAVSLFAELSIQSLAFGNRFSSLKVGENQLMSLVSVF